MAKWQVIATCAVAVLCFALAGRYAALSAVAGGLAAIFGSFAGSLVAKRAEHNTQAGAVLISLLKAEATKIIVIALLLWLTFKGFGPTLVPIALILGLGAAAILSGAAMVGLNKQPAD